MRANGWHGAAYGKKKRTTIADESHERFPGDRVNRRFDPARPNRLWVADFTYVATWTGMVYVAFVIDAFARRIIGWRAATSMTTELVLDALEHAIFADQAGISDLTGLVAHNDAGSQYTSIAFTSRLIDAGVDPSVGSVGDAYDNALAESTIGSYKTELINRCGPWRGVDRVEIETLGWVDWYNHRRLYEACGDIPPAELETAYYSQNTALAEAGHSAN